MIGPQSIPRIRDHKVARAQPELALLSALSHGNEPGGLAIVQAALAAGVGLDDERRTYYHDVIWRALGEVARKQLEESMLWEKYKYKIQSPYLRAAIDVGKPREKPRARPSP